MALAVWYCIDLAGCRFCQIRVVGTPVVVPAPFDGLVLPLVLSGLRGRVGAAAWATCSFCSLFAAVLSSLRSFALVGFGRLAHLPIACVLLSSPVHHLHVQRPWDQQCGIGISLSPSPPTGLVDPPP